MDQPQSQPNTAPHSSVAFLFTDIEGSTRLWEQQTEAMRAALACHDQIVRHAVLDHAGSLVKGTGDGIHAAFDDPLQALAAMLQMQRALADPAATAGLPLAIRCGLHIAAEEARNNDFYGPEVNRAARIMSVAHGGQMLVSQVVAEGLLHRLPDGVALRDLGEVRLKDLSRPERLWQVLAPPLREDYPALRSLTHTPHNLAQPLNRFIGRGPELAQLRGLLAQHRLVTLCGTGGIGKSRLSQHLGAELVDEFPDGVWFIELAPLTDAQRVPQAVASVLGVKEEPGRPVLEALQQFVAPRRLLIILDNCEHLLDAAAGLAKALLQAGAQVKLLATSREVLRLAGEQAWPVPALGVPAPADLAAAAHGTEPLLQHEAVRLFTDRASSANPAFQLGMANAAAVVDICRRLDGIPLALELAAARVRALSVQTIATRLRESFALLSTRDATVAPRQRTLQVLIDWSHALLSEPERVLYRRLAVFAGGWTLAAAESVCGGDEALAADEVMDLLTGLVEKSLVALVPAEGAAEPRYRLLETVRQHAAQRLAAAEQGAEALRRRHAAWALALAEQALPQLAGPEQAQVLAGLDAERENLLAALVWCAQDTAPETARHAAEQGLRLSFALRPYWPNRGLLTLGLDVALGVLAHPGAQVRDKLRARGLFNVGQLCSFMGRYAQAQGYLEDSLAIATEIGDSARVAAVLQPLVMVALGLGDNARARGHAEAAVTIAREIGNPRQVAAAVNAFAQLERTEGQLDAAETHYAETVALSRGLGDQEVVAVGLLNLAMVALGRGQAGRVGQMLHEVMQIADRIGSKPAALCALDVCACLAAAQSETASAAWLFGLAEAQYSACGLQRDPADAAFLAPWLNAVRRGADAPAFSASESEGRAMGLDQGWARAQRWLAGQALAAPGPITRSTQTDPVA